MCIQFPNYADTKHTFNFKQSNIEHFSGKIEGKSWIIITLLGVCKEVAPGPQLCRPLWSMDLWPNQGSSNTLFQHFIAPTGSASVSAYSFSKSVQRSFSLKLM